MKEWATKWSSGSTRELKAESRLHQTPSIHRRKPWIGFRLKRRPTMQQVRNKTSLLSLELEIKMDLLALKVRSNWQLIHRHNGRSCDLVSSLETSWRLKGWMSLDCALASSRAVWSFRGISVINRWFRKQANGRCSLTLKTSVGIVVSTYSHCSFGRQESANWLQRKTKILSSTTEIRLKLYQLEMISSRHSMILRGSLVLSVDGITRTCERLHLSVRTMILNHPTLLRCAAKKTSLSRATQLILKLMRRSKRWLTLVESCTTERIGRLWSWSF